MPLYNNLDCAVVEKYSWNLDCFIASITRIPSFPFLKQHCEEKHLPLILSCSPIIFFSFWHLLVTIKELLCCGGLLFKLLSYGTSTIRTKLIRNNGKWVDIMLNQLWNFELPQSCCSVCVTRFPAEEGIINTQHNIQCIPASVRNLKQV